MMKYEHKLRCAIAAILTSMITVLPWTSAQGAADYPDKPIKLIIPAPPGGGTDILGRLMGDGISRHLGKPVVVENRSGASGMIAAEQVLQAPADGYTLFMVYSGIMTVNQSLYQKNIKYDALRDFVPVASFAEVPNLLIVNPELPAKSMMDLINLAKSKPGELYYASSGNGVSNHLAMELFKQMADISMVHVPYKGGAPAMIDLLGGRVKVMFNNMVEVLPHMKAGRVRALAVATAKRSPFQPDIPTVAESGVPGYEISLWYGLVAKKGVPDSIVAKLNSAVRVIQKEPEVIEKLTKLGAQPVSQTSQEFAAQIKRELEKWARVIRIGKIKVD